MLQPETPEKKKGFLDRLPKLGRVSQLALIIGIFLILFVPLWLINQQETTKQVELKTRLANLQKVLAVEQTPKAKLEVELQQVQAQTEAARAIYPGSASTPEIIDTVLELAKLNDIYVIQTQVSTSRPAKSIGPLVTIQIGLKGQVPKFQNLMMALNDKLPTSQIKQVSFNIVGKEGEQDIASLTIEILCYEGAK